MQGSHPSRAVRALGHCPANVPAVLCCEPPRRAAGHWWNTATGRVVWIHIRTSWDSQIWVAYGLTLAQKARQDAPGQNGERRRIPWVAACDGRRRT